MRQQCNIFVRQEQAPLAKNEFVKKLDRSYCTDSTQEELDSTAFKVLCKKKEKVSLFFQPQPCVYTWDKEHEGTDNH